jgi:nicotinate-nucleotide--dimethylbenzimidazole phosphoribosyltransferase
MPLDRTLEPEIRAHLDHLTKPQGSLGLLEDLALQYCLITGSSHPVLGKKRIYTFAGDHGVTREGVSAYPREVTPQMVRNMLAGGAAVNVLARHAKAECFVVDIGVDDPLMGAEGLVRRKVRPGTGNLVREWAMSPEEARQALEVGIDLAGEAGKDGITLLGTGEMGIGNTTPSSALYAALLPCPAEAVTGRGTGIDEGILDHKIGIIKKALIFHQERLADPLKALAALGGLEIAAICGLILGGAALRIPVVVDGFISTAGALAALRLCPPVKDYLFYSHCSEEKGHRTFFEHLRLRPILDFHMRLGEGTGAALAMTLIEASVKIYNEMATFSQAGISEKVS